jgi:protein quaking
MIERVAPNMVRIFEKVFLPQRQYPTIKYPGRVIGPGGSTVKEVNNLTGCKLLVRGKGSFKIPHQEDSMKTVAGFEHLEEEMHVLIEASGSEAEANAKLQYAKQIILEIIPPEANPSEIVQKYTNWGRIPFMSPQYAGQMPPQQMGFQGGPQGYPMANPTQQMGFNPGGAPQFMGGPQTVPSYGMSPPGQPQFGPQQFGPQQFGPQQYGPQQFGPQQFGPQQYGPQQYGPQQYGGQPYLYAQSPVQQYAPVLPPQLAVTLPSLPPRSQSTVSKVPPLPPGVDPPKAQKVDVSQPKSTTSSQEEQNDEAKKNGLGMLTTCLSYWQRDRQTDTHRHTNTHK